MGIQQSIEFEEGQVPQWEKVRDLLTDRGFPTQMRMINDQLAFPDETPPEDWQEIRIGTPQGMVTVRRDSSRLTFITWSNADQPMIQAWNALAWAFAAAGSGKVLLPDGPVTAEEFVKSAELPETFRT